MADRSEPGRAGRPLTAVRVGLVMVGLLVGACTQDGTATDEIGTCSLADLTVGAGPGDGAGGHAISLIGFRNDGPEPCTLTDPTAVETTPATSSPIERGRLFFPVEKLRDDLAPTASAYVAVETTSCPVGGGSSIESVAVSFENDVVVDVPLAVASTCGTRWEGFITWQ